MTNLRKSILTFSTTAALLTMTMGSASAAPFVPDRLVQVQDELIDWLRLNVIGMPIGDRRPIYVFETPQKMTIIYFGLGYSGDRKVMGIQQDGQIILRQDFDPDQHQEILLHELFHFFVEASGRRRGYFACTVAEEQVAYAVQNKYVREVKHGRGIIAGEQFENRNCLQMGNAESAPAAEIHVPR